MFRKIKRFVKDPYYALGYDMIKKCPNLMSDKFYLSILWKICMGYKIDWKNPRTFNEKLQWLKLYDRNPLYTTLVDKYRVKQWVADRIGKQYVIPTLAVYNSVDEIDLSKLPDQFVLKCNHDSGSVVICRDKATFDFESAKRKLDAGLKRNFYWSVREWPYKNVKRCVFAEQFMKDASMEDDLLDNKLFIGGQPKIIQVSFDLFKWHKCKLYDTHWNYVEGQLQHVTQQKEYNNPNALDEMLGLCEKIVRYFTQVYADFYLIDNKIYFGELTYKQSGGLDGFRPEELGLQSDNYVQLPGNKRYCEGAIVQDGFVLYLHCESSIPSFIGLKDYKWFCFNGEPKIMYIANDKAEFPTEDFFDMDFNPLSIYINEPPSFELPKKPKQFEEMKEMAAILSRNIPQVRVDFYESYNQILFGEMTFFRNGGMGEIYPIEWSRKMGDWIKLPNK